MKKCSSGLLICKKSAHLACSSETKCSSRVISTAHLKKKCSSCVLIWKKCAHLTCSSERKCSSRMLIQGKVLISLCSSEKKCSSSLLIYAHLKDEHLSPLCPPPKITDFRIKQSKILEVEKWWQNGSYIIIQGVMTKFWFFEIKKSDLEVLI